MGRKNASNYSQELIKLVDQYETAIAEKTPLYLDADQLADIADRYSSEKLFNQAQEVISYGLHLHPESMDLLIEQAYLYLDTKKIKLAQTVADSITEQYEIEVKMLKAEILLNEGQLDAAKDLFVTMDKEGDLGIAIDVTYLYLDMGYPEAAKEWLDAAAIGYSHEEDFTATEADYLAATGQLEEAILRYNRLIDLDPYNAAYWMGVAKCYFTKGEYEKTVEACDFSLAADEKWGEAYVYRAHSFFYLNNSTAAIDDYQKGMEYKAITPELAYMFIGMAYSHLEEWEKADECYTMVIRFFEETEDDNSPLLVDVYNNKAISTFQLGNCEEAHLLCEKAKAINPNDINNYLTEGKLYIKEELDEQAFESFHQIVKEESTAEKWYLIGMTYLEEDWLYESKLCFEKCYKLDPTYADISERLSVLSLIHNEIDNFFKYNQECLEPLDEDSILTLLSQYEQMDQIDEGKSILLNVWERMNKERNK